MKILRLLLASSMLFALTGPAWAWNERPLTITEGRTAVGWFASGPMFAGVAFIVGETAEGNPPGTATHPARYACVSVEDYERGYFDQACAPVGVFVDDLFTQAAGTVEIPSKVVDTIGNVIADSSLSVSGTWSRDVLDCHPYDDPQQPVDAPYGERSYLSAPVFPAVELEVETQCEAHVSLSIESRYLGSVGGDPHGVLGLYAGEFWRLPQQNYPVANAN